MTRAGESDDSQGNADAAAMPEPTVLTSTASLTPAADSEGVRFTYANSVPATPMRPVGRKRNGKETLASIADFLTRKQQRMEDTLTLSTSSRVFGIHLLLLVVERQPVNA